MCVCVCVLIYLAPQMRNKLNQEQNSKLQQHKDMLNKRNQEVSMMDRRIEELRERLYRKKAEVCVCDRVLNTNKQTLVVIFFHHPQIVTISLV